MLSTSSRLRIVSNRLALHSLKPLSLKAAKKSFVPSTISYFNQTRAYGSKDNKQVSYTVDKFPGYVRNESYKKVSKVNVLLNSLFFF